MSNLFGGSSGSNKGAQNLFVPAFTSPGGVTGQQSDLANYLMGQSDINQANEFSQGTGMSTMLTQLANGAGFGGAQELGQMSDINQGAAYADYSNAVQSLTSQLSSGLPVNNAGLASTASNLGQEFKTSSTGAPFTSGNTIT